ncbi:MAG TPA: MFS transporter [Terrimesophilobacter sp.]|nr:MFS transporter [Terrimesophilobacter sp.]
MDAPRPIVRGKGLWAAVAVVLVALNLRPTIVAVSPLLDEISADLELTSFTAGMLMTLPVLCFGALGPLAPVFARRFGLERSLGLVLVLIIVGSAVRLHPSVFGLFLGTFFVGAGIALGNILLPALIKRDFPDRVGLMSGLFSMALTGGATLAAGVTLPVAQSAGLDWSVTLALWGVFALVALVCWVPYIRSALGSALVRRGTDGSLARDRVAWWVTAMFGLQSLNFYSMTAWLPTMLIAAGSDAVFAGLMLSLVNFASIPAATFAPMLAGRLRSQAWMGVVIGVPYVIAHVGLIWWTLDFPALWAILLGIGQGATISLALTLIVLRSPTADVATTLSGMAQSWGYLFAAAGPLTLGLLNDLTGSWVIPLLVLLVLVVPQTWTSYLAGLPRMVRPSSRLD